MRLPLLLSAVVSILAVSWWLAAEERTPPPRNELRKQFEAGNFKVAYDGYRVRVLDPKTDPATVSEDLATAVQALQQLGRIEEFDEFVEAAVAAHAKNWRLLQTAARLYRDGESWGFIVAGKFYRGAHRGGGKYVSSSARDRVRALQLLQQAQPLAAADAAKADVARFYQDFAQTLQQNEAWRLQTLTDLATLPDYEEGNQFWGRRGFGWGGPGADSKGAPVNEDGSPVLHAVPKSWDAAASDGERWRWMLLQTVEADAGKRNEVDLIRARFLHGQFGVQTIAWLNRGQGRDDDEDDSGPYAVHTLGDEETIAKLATGVRRFKLPDEHNPLKLFQQVFERAKDDHGRAAGDLVAQTYEDRRQYVKAATAWKAALAKFGNEDHRQQRLDQIVGNWGRFENLQMLPAGKGATIDLRFRNGSQVALEAQAIRVDKLLEDVKTYLKGAAGNLEWQRINIQDLGYRLVTENQKQYLGETVANWTLDLTPKPEHQDAIVSIATPLQKAGAYLVTAKMKNGNVSRVIVWLADTALVRKPLDGQSLYFVADAVTGKPVPKANVEFLGWRQVQLAPGRPEWKITTANFAEFTNADGLLTLPSAKVGHDHQWLIMARTPEGRLAYTGFTHAWWGQRHDEQYQATRVFTITDRPVYRPDQTVKFKMWLEKSQYDLPETSAFAAQKFTVRIHNPQGEQIFEKEYTTDAYGGLEGEFAVPKGAMLGNYGLQIADPLNQGGSFRVEEYKKPEYEVTVDAPKEPVALGETVKATIRAKYYFGAPVTQAKVRYKVLRSAHDSHWYPHAPWDWLYGRGYWWFASDYSWYPGWNRWGCMRPIGWWIGRQNTPPEIVAEQEVEIGPEGTVEIAIDTAPAKAVHGDEDHSYSVTAEVVDNSRRTIVGTGQVLVSRQPFRVFAWVDRGHYKVGDTIQARFDAHTLDNTPVQGTGELTLFKITYDDKQQPVEEAVQTWKLNPDEAGRAQKQIAATAPGQYRLSYKVTDRRDHTIEGGYVFVIRGEGFDGREFRFNDLELVTDRAEYAPGETVRLMISTNRPDATVVLFVRPSNGIYLPPKLVRLKGKNTVEDIAVVQKDMPNFFIEAFTIAEGKYHQEAREVVVPPEKRVLNVAVEASQAEYRPGADAELKIKLTDATGKPFVGSTVVTVYDRSVEAIAGGSNVPEIREFFWKWRRNHFPQRDCTLDRWFQNVLKGGEIPMADLGVFGGMVDALKEMEGTARFSGGRGRRMQLRGEMAAPGAPQAEMTKDRMMMDGAVALNAAAAPGLAGDAGGGADPAAVTIRSNFADTAFWAGTVTTDESGLAQLQFKMPESLTGWKIRTWAMGLGTRVGQGEAEVTTRKNLLVRLQAPRFFVEKDEVVLSANVHNYFKTPQQALVSLELPGKTLELLTRNREQAVMVPAGGEVRVDWRVKVTAEGTANVIIKAVGDEESDAMQMTFPAYIHGMLKTESFSGALRPADERGSVRFTVPAERRQNDSRLEVRYSPTLAGAMVDALPYLVEYPYGCTEQTLNRFVPTVVTQRILKTMNLDLKAIQDKRTNLNAQEIGDDRERARRWKQWDRNPVFDEAEVQSMVKDGLERLTAMQCSDGGWGWFSGWGEHSWPHTTAVVVHGLQVAQANDVALVPGMLDRGLAWLEKYEASQVQLIKDWGKRDVPQKQHADALDALVFQVLGESDRVNTEMRTFLDRDRVQLPAYAKALFGLALHRQKQADMLQRVMENLEQFVVQDDENQTAWLKLPEDQWWYWYNNDIEANAYYLKLLSLTAPQDPRAARLVKYILNNRRHGTYWKSTRDSALCIEALADFMKAAGEDKPDLTIEVWLDGKKQKDVQVNAGNLFTFENKFVLEGDAVTTGEHTLELRKKGTGPLYYNAYLTNFTLEDFITKAGLEVKVGRKFYKLTRSDKQVDAAGSRGQAVKQKVEKYDRTELANLDSLKSGDLVEIELEIDSKNDYEYLMFEDLKASGFEPVEVRSGYNGNDLGAYVEFRDERVVFFVRQLMRGKHSVSYRLRAEIPGKFSALPARASAMYSPELKANSDEMKLGITD